MRHLGWIAIGSLFALGCGGSGAGSGGGGGAGASASTGSASGGGSPTSSGGGAGGASSSSGGGSGGAPPAVVDATSIDHKMLLGYQGWFSCAGDGSPPNAWVHWFRSQTPDASQATVDLWPDLRELDADELFATNMTYGDGSVAGLYSAFVPKSVARHFGWMKDAGIDGVWLQRFSSELHDPAFLALRDQVARNVLAGAEANGRVFALMYDVSGQDPATMVADLEADWTHLVDDLGLTASNRYLHNGGKPVLAIWGLGFSDRPGTPQQAQQLIDYFHSGADAQHQVFLMGGVPTNWRTLNGDSQSNPAWSAVYLSFDVISPWSVGRYVDLAGADQFAQNQVAPDLAAVTQAGRLYMPVVFPGFSWHNLMGAGSPPDQIPRLGGTFYWRQVYDDLTAGSTMLYGAMFDEVDEGTAMFKIAETQAKVPGQGTWVSLDADGTALPSDWYLRLAGEATKRVRGDAPLSPNLPIQP